MKRISDFRLINSIDNLCSKDLWKSPAISLHSYRSDILGLAEKDVSIYIDFPSTKKCGKLMAHTILAGSKPEIKSQRIL